MDTLCGFLLAFMVTRSYADDSHFCTMQTMYKTFESNLETYLANRDITCGTHLHSDCKTLQNTFPNAKSGVYFLKPNDKGATIFTYCDMTTDGGGWLVIQRRTDGSVDFDRSWIDYQEGFGNKTGEFWLGLNNIHRLTSQDNVELRVEIETSNGSKGFAHYWMFSVGNMSTFYRLAADGYSGNIGDSLSPHNGMKFSARDFDLDSSASSCATQNKGGWWFNDCLVSNLNGHYDSVGHPPGIVWTTWSPEALTSAVMKIRPHSYPCGDEVNGPLTCFNAVDGEDCQYIQKKQPTASSGIYTIDPRDGKGPFRVFCDMTTDGGGWMVFQRRMDGSEDFYRTWDEYKNGFGLLSREFYLGNEKIHRLTSNQPSFLRIDLTDKVNNTAYATYTNFAISNVTDRYRLSVGQYRGNAGDSVSRGNGFQFSTKDQDNDAYRNLSCATTYHGAWWYDRCHGANLNGLYNNDTYGLGVDWLRWHGYNYSLKATEMKIRQRNNQPGRFTLA